MALSISFKHLFLCQIFMLWIYVNDKDVGKERAAADVQGSESFRISELQV